VIREYLLLGPEGRRTDPRIGRDRHTLIMSGAAILQALMRVWPTDRLSVADRGLREGLLYAQMSAMACWKTGRSEAMAKPGGTSGRGQRDLRCGSRPRRGASCPRPCGWSGS
jgi:exopolyphosphatase/pppGpp-phosphohydrolase